MGWSCTSPQPHLKREYKALMPLTIFKEKRKKRTEEKERGKEKEGRKKGRERKKQIRN